MYFLEITAVYTKIHLISTTDHCLKESQQLSAYANLKYKA